MYSRTQVRNEGVSVELKGPQNDVNRGLFWVQGDLGHGLQRARGLIETYLDEGPEQLGLLEQCVDELRQIANIASVIQCYSVYLLASEMVETVQFAINTPVEDGEANFAALVAATLQVSDYIELLAHGETDHPLVFAPNINDLRVARGAQAQSRAVLFSRFMDVRGLDVLPPDDAARRKPGMSQALARKVAPVMQKAVSGVIRDVQRDKSLELLGKAAGQLASVACDPQVYLCWQGVTLMCEVLAHEPELANPDVHTLITKAGQCAKALAANGEEAIATAAGRLGAQCMHLGTLAEEPNLVVERIREEFALGGADVTYTRLQALRERLSKPSIDSLQTVTREIRHNISDIKDSIDLALRSHTLGDVSESLVARLESVSSTLMVLGLDALGQLARSQAEAIAALQGSDDEGAWLDVAETLIRIEQGLEAELMPPGRDALVDETAHQDLREGINAILRESLVNISRIKTELAQYIARGQESALISARDMLAEMASGFELIGRDRPTQVIRSIEGLLVAERVAPARHRGALADRLADVIAGVEYYLEALKEKQPHAEHLLDEVERYLGAFDDAFHAAASVDEIEEAPAAPVEQDIDPEFREVFIEESREVMAELDAVMPRWAQNPSDPDVLATVRRAFHTLKGSGRMVGASDIGEFAWSIEDMLNRCLDGALTLNGEISSLITEAVGQLPEIVRRFAEGESALELVQPMQQKARAAIGETSNDDAAEVLAIFKDDAAGELDVLANRLAAGGDVVADQDLERALHTLRGGAATAGVTGLASLAESAERLVQGLRSCNQVLPASVLEQLHASMVAQLNAATTEHSVEPDLALEADLAQRLAELQADSDGVDLELAAIFAEEAAELLGEAESELKNWAAQPDSGTAQQNLQRIFHTIKGSARTAGGMGLGQIGEALDALMKDVIDGQVTELNQTLFERLGRCVLLTYDLLDEFREGRDADPSAALAALSGDAPPVDSQTEPELTLALDDEQAGPDADNAGIDLSLGAEGDQPTWDLGDEASAPELADAATSESTDVESLDMDFSDAEDVWPADPEILEMFQIEAQELLESMDRHFADWEANTQAQEPLRALQRELHTFKGGARMAGLNGMGAVAHQMESIFARIESGDQADSQTFGHLHHAIDGLHQLLDEVKQGRQPVGARELLSDLISDATTAPGDEASQVVDSANERDESVPFVMPPQASPTDTVTFSTMDLGDDAPAGADSEMVEIFLPEAQELMEAFDAARGRWSENHQDSDALAEILRVLHTLKGGARMAGLAGLGDDVHNLESELEAVSREGQGATPELLERLQRSSDGFHQHMAQAASGGGVTAPQQDAQEQTSTHPVLDLPGDYDYRSDALDDIQPRAWSRDLQWEAPQDERLAAIRRETARVSVEQLDNMLNEAGEISIYRSRLERQVSAFSGQLREVEQTIARIRDQLRMLESETDAQIQSRTQGLQSEEGEGDRYGEEFDPLEMDRYSRMQELTRALSESVTDLFSLHATMTDVVSETDTLLLQQGRVNTSVQQGLMGTLMVPFSRQVQRLQRVARQTAGEHGKQIELQLQGIEAEMDRNVLERMTPVIEHVVRNCVIHGIETPDVRAAAGKPPVGRMSISLARDGSKLAIEIRDDGAGLDFSRIREKAIERGLMGADAQLSEAELAQFIFQPGFSTAQALTQDAGRGVGMDVVSSEVKQLGGTLELDSKTGHGARFVIRLPLSLAISQALLVQVGEEVYAAPLSTIEGIARIPRSDLERYMDDDERFAYGDQEYRVRYLGQLLGLDAAPADERDHVPVILVHSGEGMGISERRVAVVVDQLLGSRELVTKTAGPQVSTVVGVTGATIQADGRVVLILDVVALVQDRLFKTLQAGRDADGGQVAGQRVPLVMVIDDSITMRRVAERLLTRNGYRVATAKDGMDGIAQLQAESPDAVLLDIEMPKVDGFEVATFIRNNERLASLPIIMITSRSGDKHRERAQAIGVNRYLIKPYQEQQLITELRDVMAEA